MNKFTSNSPWYLPIIIVATNAIVFAYSTDAFIAYTAYISTVILLGCVLLSKAASRDSIIMTGTVISQTDPNVPIRIEEIFKDFLLLYKVSLGCWLIGAVGYLYQTYGYNLRAIFILCFPLFVLHIILILGTRVMKIHIAIVDSIPKVQSLH